MTATVIVALFSFLSATSYGAGGSVKGMLAALSAYRFLLGIGVGAEVSQTDELRTHRSNIFAYQYPCGSVAASEQSEEEGVQKNAQHRWFVLATSKPPYHAHLWSRCSRRRRRHHDRSRLRYRSTHASDPH